MDVGQIMLGPWLYDNDVTIHGRSNMCRFEHKCKKIKLKPYRLIAIKLKSNASKKSKGANLISAVEHNQELKNGAPCMILATKKVVKMPDRTTPSKVNL